MRQPVAILFPHATGNNRFRIRCQHGFIIDTRHKACLIAKHILTATNLNHLADQVLVVNAH